MANWAWPHTPADNWARMELHGGPFDGEQAGFLPPDTTAPVQIAWSGWFPWGPACYLYEWRHEVRQDRGRTVALVYRPARLRLYADDVPPVVGQDADLYADAADLLLSFRGFPGSSRAAISTREDR